MTPRLAVDDDSLFVIINPRFRHGRLPFFRNFHGGGRDLVGRIILSEWTPLDHSCLENLIPCMLKDLDRKNIIDRNPKLL